MTFIISVLLIVVLISTIWIPKKAKTIMVSVTVPLLIVGLAILYGTALQNQKDTVNDERGFTQESVTKVVSVTHALGEGRYIVEMDKGTYKTSEEYDVYEDVPLIKESTAKTVETGYSKLPPMNWLTPWEYHRSHVDIIHFPANEIKVVP